MRPSHLSIASSKSSPLRIGQPVVALGAPLGLASTVTTAIVSALDRSVNVPAAEEVILAGMPKLRSAMHLDTVFT